MKSKQNELINIKLDDILPNPNQSRLYFDDKSLNNLKESIMSFGVLEPIRVKKTGRFYELICGERRYRAAQLAGLCEIPAIVTKESECAVLSLLENLQRQDLTFFEVARSYEQLMETEGLTRDELAKKVGKSKLSVCNKLRLLNFSMAQRKLIREYDLTEKHALALLRLRNEDEQMEVLKKVCINRLSVEETNKLIDEILHPKKKPIIKDNLSLFKNTINNAVKIMNTENVNATLNEEKLPDKTRYIIEIYSRNK